MKFRVDRRNVNSNPNGLVYGVHEDSSDFVTVSGSRQEFVYRDSHALQTRHADVRAGRTAAAFALLGERAGGHLPRVRAQLDDGFQGPNLDRGRDA